MKDSTAPHQLEFTIWRNEADASVRVKVRKPDALVEAAVVQFDRVAHAFLALVDHELVVEPEFALGRPRKVRPHLDVSVDICP